MSKEDTTNYEKASATLLAQQASEVSETRKRNKDWVQERSHYETRLIAMRNWRQSWWSQNWSDLSEFILPRRSIWLTQTTGGIPTPNNMTRGRPINTSIVDPTATLAVRVCSAGLMSGLASPSRPWFKMIPSLRKLNLDDAARAWIDETENRMYTIIAGSNFYNAFAQECEDLVVFGTAPSIVYEDAADIIRLYNPAVGEYYLDTDATGRIDSFYRLFVMNVSQIVDFFGIENCTKEVQGLWKEKGNQLTVERMIAHAIEPNYELEGGVGKIPGNFSWKEAYWIYGANEDYPLAKRGFVDQPFTASRWALQSNDAYGRSPGMDVIPDVLQLQVMTRRHAEAIEKMVRPPLIGDMSLKNKPTSTLPGHLTYVSDMGPQKGIRPIYEVNPDISGMVTNIQAVEKRIQAGFFNDLFLMLEQGRKDRETAYEVAQKVQEKLQVLGPVIESLLAESLKPKLKRIFNIMKRKQLIDPIPDSLRGIPLDVEFVSMLSIAQKGAATGGMERLIAALSQVEDIFPQAKDNLNIDLFVREYNDLLGNPHQIMHGPDQVQKIREEIQQQVQQQQQMQKIQAMSQAAGNAAPLAKTLLQNGGGQGQPSQLLGG